MASEEPNRHQQYTGGELLSSAKVVAEAAQSTFNHQSDVDKAKVADAAGDLLGGARQYGKLDEKGLGSYVDKAEDYLHQYGGGQPEKPDQSHGEDPAPAPKKPESESHGEGQSEGGGGVGDYLKIAQGFLSK